MRIGVVGAGLMGAGIAQVSAVAGHDVVLQDVNDGAVARGRDGIAKSLAKFAEKGKISAEDEQAALARVSTTTELDAMGEVDIVVEAVFEKIEIKTEVFERLDKICAPGTLLATNTSAIPITSIAAVTSRPEDVVGTHFFPGAIDETV